MKTTAMTSITYAALVLLTASTVHARWAIRPQEVPVDRLLKNTEAWIADHPEDPRGHYVLGRVHSMAFATRKDQVTVGQSFNAKPEAANPLPSFLPYRSVKVQPVAGKNGQVAITSEQLIHLEASIRHYRKAIELAGKEEKENDAKVNKTNDVPRAMLGLAWMLEVAGQNRDAIKTASVGEDVRKLDADARTAINKFVKQSSDWKALSVAAYQTAFKATRAADKTRQFSGPGADSLISLDAAQSIIRLLDTDKPTEEETALVAQMKQYIKDKGRIGRVVTPIIFSLRTTESLADHLQPGKVVKFDLDGDGVASRWPWLRSETCLLVWDPQQTGNIRDGRQLFGSVTWWISWDNGYQPLAALDNDHDGWLTGKELTGLSVWQDRNSNGRSDDGEVVPVGLLKIRRIAARPDTRRDNVPVNTVGIELESGRSVPTYDWTPASLPQQLRPGG